MKIDTKIVIKILSLSFASLFVGAFGAYFLEYPLFFFLGWIYYGDSPIPKEAENRFIFIATIIIAIFLFRMLWKEDFSQENDMKNSKTKKDS